MKAPKKSGGLFSRTIAAERATKAAKPAATIAPNQTEAAKPVEPPKPAAKPKASKATATTASVHADLSKLPKADAATTAALVHGAHPSEADAHAIAASKTRLLATATPHELTSMKAYANPDTSDYTSIRAAEMSGAKDAHGEHAANIRAAVTRDIARNPPVTLYRGMSVPPDVADSLMRGRSIDLKATSSFSPKSSEAVDFSTGFGEATAGHIPVVVTGRLRGATLPHSPEVEVVLPRAKLRILKKSVVDHPTHGRMLVLHVDDGS